MPEEADKIIALAEYMLSEGKMFVAFFSLILRYCMQNRLKTYMSDNSLTFTGVLKELNKLKSVYTSDGRKLLTPVTKRQRDILSACSVPPDDIHARIDDFPSAGCMV